VTNKSCPPGGIVSRQKGIEMTYLTLTSHASRIIDRIDLVTERVNDFEPELRKAVKSYLEKDQKMKYPKVINEYGKEIDFDAAVNIMDDDLREQLNNELAPCTNQKFFEAYAKAHLEKFDEEFEPNKANPAW